MTAGKSAAARTPALILPTRHPGMLVGTDPMAASINEWVRGVWERLGPDSGLTLFPTDILVAHYVRDRVGRGHIIAAHQTQNEDKYQGKCGLVVAVGSEAFKDAPDTRFYGFKAEVGEWVIYKNSDGRDLEFVPPKGEKLLMRSLRDGEIFMKASRPDQIW